MPPSPQFSFRTFLSPRRNLSCQFAVAPHSHSQTQEIPNLLASKGHCIYMESYKMFRIWLVSLCMSFWGSFILLYVSELCSFFLLNCSSLYSCRICCLFTLQLMNSWVVSIFWPLQIMLLWISMYKPLCGHIFPFSQETLGMDCWVIVNLDLTISFTSFALLSFFVQLLKKLSNCLPKLLHYFTFPCCSFITRHVNSGVGFLSCGINSTMLRISIIFNPLEAFWF